MILYLIILSNRFNMIIAEESNFISGTICVDYLCQPSDPEDDS